MAERAQAPGALITSGTPAIVRSRVTTRADQLRACWTRDSGGTIRPMQKGAHRDQLIVMSCRSNQWQLLSRAYN